MSCAVAPFAADMRCPNRAQPGWPLWADALVENPDRGIFLTFEGLRGIPRFSPNLSYTGVGVKGPFGTSPVCQRTCTDALTHTLAGIRSFPWKSHHENLALFLRSSACSLAVFWS